MSRRSKPARRIPAPDAVYNSVDIASFINRLMRRGKKSVAERIFYSTLENLKTKSKDEPLEVFKKALTNATPLLEVKARRIGGSTYQVPLEVKADRGMVLGSTIDLPLRFLAASINHVEPNTIPLSALTSRGT